ncbi:MAG: AraC family transcriptional regulator [Lentisphaerae bacterium]|nr:MAG: AraC family transcriptional regulator [Lentisphaerota bacterium]
MSQHRDLDQWLEAVNSPDSIVTLKRCVHAIWAKAIRGRRMFMDLHLVLYAQRGTLHARVNNREFEVPPGGILWIPPGFEKEFRCEKPSSSLRVHFEVNLHDTPVLWWPEPVLRLDCMEAEFYFHKLYRLFHHEGLRSGYKLRALLTLVSQVFDAGRERRERHPGLSLHQQHIVEDFIQTHYSQPITSQEIAKRLNLTQDYTARLFRRTYGCSPREYIRNERLRRAAELLLETEVNVDEVARAVGIGNVGLFCRMFKKHFGMTPSEYRHRSGR